jgi:hypothetical protein
MEKNLKKSVELCGWGREDSTLRSHSFIISYWIIPTVPCTISWSYDSSRFKVNTFCWLFYDVLCFTPSYVTLFSNILRFVLCVNKIFSTALISSTVCSATSHTVFLAATVPYLSVSNYSLVVHNLQSVMYSRCTVYVNYIIESLWGWTCGNQPNQSCDWNNRRSVRLGWLQPLSIIISIHYSLT